MTDNTRYNYKYNESDRNRYLILTIISFLGIGIDYYVFHISETYYELMGLLDKILPFLFVCFLFFYLDSVIYLNKLKKYKSSQESSETNNGLAEMLIEYNAESDHKLIIILSLAFYFVVLSFDFRFWFKWFNYDKEQGDSSLCLLLLFHLIFPIITFYSIVKPNKIQTISKELSSNRKIDRSNVTMALVTLSALSFFSLISIYLVDELSRYMHLSYYSNCGQSLEYFQKHATMEIHSDDLNNGVWAQDILSCDKTTVRSPHLYFEPIKDADHYVVYMAIESNGCYGTWLATEIQENELFNGDNLTIHANDPYYRYTGNYIYPPDKSPLLVSVYVFALKSEPNIDLSDIFNDWCAVCSQKPNELYSYYLSPSKTPEFLKHGFHIVSDKYNGNVISYGYITGVYYPQ